MAILGNGNLIPESFTKEKDLDIIKQRMQRDIERVIERILRFATNKPDMLDLIRKFKVDHLLFGLLCSNMGLIKRIINLEELLDFKDLKVFDTIKELAHQDAHIPDLDIFFNFYEEIEEDDSHTLEIPNIEVAESIYNDFIKDLYDKVTEKRFEKFPDENINDPEYDWNNKMYKDEFGYIVDEEGISIEASVLFEIILKAGYGDRFQILLLLEILIPLFRNVPCGVNILKL